MAKHLWGWALLALVMQGLLMAQTTSVKSPWAGIWRLVPEKSSAAAPSSGTVRIEDVADGIHVTSDSVSKAGTTSHTEYTATFGGGDVAVAGAPAEATAAVTRTGPRTFDVVTRSQGTTTTSRNEISADGRIRTVTSRLVIGNRESSMTLVYERER